MDQVGISLSGHELMGRHPTVDFAERMTGTPAATMWCEGTMVHAPYAALANRCAGDELELCAGPECVAAAVAAGEMADASVGDLLDAIVVAAEVEEYLRGWLMIPMERHGLHPPAVLGAIASATASGRLLHLEPEPLRGALATAASLTPQSAYTAFSSGASGKALYGGWGQMLGLWAAMWSGTGMVGPATALDGTRGIAQAFLDAVEPVVAPPFEPDGLAITRVTFKAYPCNRASHAALAALDQLDHDTSLDWNDIESVSVETYPYAVDLDRRSVGDTPIAAQLSIRTTIALRLVFGALEPARAFTTQTLEDPRVRELARKVTVGVLPNMTRDGARVRTARVEVRMSGGSRHQAHAEATWSVGAPATDTELRRRFERFTNNSPSFDPWIVDDVTRVRRLVASK